MKTVFDELREELAWVAGWLEAHLKLPLPAKERQFAIQLKKYVAHCYRDQIKWRSESAASHARIKLQAGWGWLFMQNANRRL